MKLCGGLLGGEKLIDPDDMVFVFYEYGMVSKGQLVLLSCPAMPFL
jgi:hypothetical protein